MKVLYLAVTPDKFEFPIYITETMTEMSRLTGYSNSGICRAIHRYEDGALPTWSNREYYFRKVEIEEECFYGQTSSC